MMRLPFTKGREDCSRSERPDAGQVTMPSSLFLKIMEDEKRYREALERVAEMAERSDAHPELAIAPIAREAMTSVPSAGRPGAQEEARKLAYRLAAKLHETIQNVPDLDELDCWDVADWLDVIRGELGIKDALAVRAAPDDFYEEDEPIEDIKAIAAKGPHGVTAPPGFTVNYESPNKSSASLAAEVKASRSQLRREATQRGEPMPTFDGKSDGVCGFCGKDPADGWALIMDTRYCHEGPSPTCYEKATRERGLQLPSVESSEDVGASPSPEGERESAQGTNTGRLSGPIVNASVDETSTKEANDG